MGTILGFLDKNGLAAVLTDLRAWLSGNLSKKVDKQDGKVLSSNDFTDELLEKLNNTPRFTYGTEDLEAGVSYLTPGDIYIVYEEA